MRFKTRQERAGALATARELTTKAQDEGRDLTKDEVSQIDDVLEASKDYQRRTTVEAKAQELGLGSTAEPGEHFDLSAKGAAAFARRALISGGGVGIKAPLDAAAVADLPTTRETGVELLPAAERTFLSVFETRKRDTRTWTYPVQTVRDDQATIVPAGGEKPTSRYGLTSRGGELHPVAHLSEPIDKYMLRDSQELEGFLAGEMARGVFDAIEAVVLNGHEDDDHGISGLLTTSGVPQIAAGVDQVSTLRTALATIETNGYVPGAVVMTPNTWAGIEAYRNMAGLFDANGPIEPTERKVWGVPVFTSARLTDGQAIAVDRSAVIVSVDSHGVEVEWDSAGERFARNEYICRAETRVDVEVRRPAGIAVATLAPAGGGDDEGE